MKTISLRGYSPVLCDNEKAQEVLSQINTILSSGDDVEIDFDGILSMATCCSRLIFAELYNDLGPQNFIRRIAIKNASESVQKTIRAGIKGK